jgi:peptide/nickel transport system permease protein
MGPSLVTVPESSGVEDGSVLLLSPGLLGEGVRKRHLSVLFWASAGWIALIVMAAILANALPLDNPTAIGNAAPGLGPSWGHLLGTDELGRDMLSRVIFGARISLIVGVTSTVLGLSIGGTLGLIAGYVGGIVDTLISGVVNVLLAFPSLILALAIVTFAGPSLFHVTIAIGVLSIAPLARVVRANTIGYARREFVQAAQVLGVRQRRIIFREIVPNVLPTALSVALVTVPAAILAEGALSFLGLSIQPPTPSWGNMISEGRDVLAKYPLIALWPCLCMLLTVLALNFIGDEVRAYFDGRAGGL